MAEAPAICKACGTPLGHPDEEVNDPEADATPDDPHFEVVRKDGDDKERFRCLDTGQIASPVAPDDDNYEEVYEEHHSSSLDGDGGSPPPTESEENQEGSSGVSPDQVFDFDEEKSQMEILADVVTNPHYELDEAQVREIRSWAQDYEGQMPPNVLEDLLKNMKGVQKQTAQLVRQRYELKLNKWVRKKQQGEQGPPIGVTGGRPMPQSRTGRSSPTPTPSSSPTPTPNPDTSEEKPELDEGTSDTGDGSGRDALDDSSPFNSDLRQERRKRRIERRNEAMDVAVEEMAHEMAPEVARELANNFGTYFGLPAKILEAKAEQDPDWFLEKMDEFEEKLGINMTDILEESDAKKEQRNKQQQQGQAEVDNELDEALEEMNTENPNQTNNRPPNVSEAEHPMKSTPDGGSEPEEQNEAHDEMEDMFSDTFGGEE